MASSSSCPPPLPTPSPLPPPPSIPAHPLSLSSWLRPVLGVIPAVLATLGDAGFVFAFDADSGDLAGILPDHWRGFGQGEEEEEEEEEQWERQNHLSLGRFQAIVFETGLVQVQDRMNARSIS